MAAVIAVLLAAGCTSTPEKEASNVSSQNENIKAPIRASENQGQDRYVEINLLDGTKVGGKYVSETAAFTTIDIMYTMDPTAYTWDANNTKHKDPARYFVKANGAEISLKNSLINSMITIEDPTAMIEATQQEMNEIAAVIQKAADDKAEAYRIAKEKREAKQNQTD
jgi:hypothetical protein